MHLRTFILLLQFNLFLRPKRDLFLQLSHLPLLLPGSIFPHLMFEFKLFLFDKAELEIFFLHADHVSFFNDLLNRLIDTLPKTILLIFKFNFFLFTI